MTRYIFSVTLAICITTASADEPLPKLPLAQEAAALTTAEATGLILYRHDQAAAAATDAALKLKSFKKDTRIQGWITQEQPGQIMVTFIDQTPAALYRVSVSNEGVAGTVSALETPGALTPYEAGAATARAAALASKFQPCAKRYNTVVLPSNHASEDSWVVYLMPGTTQKNIVPIGGTYRIDVNGSNIIAQRAFTRSCVALQTAPQAVALFITSLLDPSPTEAHVFWSLWAKRPIYVNTVQNGVIWTVTGNQIRPVEYKHSQD